MPEFRPVTREERVRHEELIDHAFRPDAGPPRYDGPDEVEDSLAERWGLFEDGDFLAGCLIYDLEATLAGDVLPVGGLGAFSTPPEHRAAGHGTVLQEELLATFRDRDYPFSVMWPVSIPYYRRTDWALLHLETEYAFPPDAIAGIDSAVDEGTFEQVRPGDLDRIRPIYGEFRERHSLALDRSAEWWRQRVLDNAWAYCWTPSGADDPTGYVIYTLPGEQGDMRLSIDELVATDETARRALLGFVARHLPQVEAVEWQCPEETRLVHEATDPKAVEATARPGAMGRIVDVPAAIEALPADRNPEARVTVSVDDPLVPANEGVFAIEAGTAGPTCESVADDRAPDVSLGIGVLSKLYAGTAPVATLCERGDLAADDSTRRALATLFPSGPVYLADFF